MNFRTGHFRRPVLWLLAIVLLAGQFSFQSADLAHASHAECDEILLTPTYEGYVTSTVELCLEVDGASLAMAGVIKVSATLQSVSGPNQSARSVKFSFDKQVLLTDFDEPYQFKWETRRWPDGDHLLSGTALLRSGESVTVASQVTLANHGDLPPKSEPFSAPQITQPKTNSPIVVAAVGDGPDGGSGAAAVGDLIGSWNANLLIYLGDVYDDGRPDEFDNWYEAALGPLRGITMPALGNHEFEHGEANGYQEYWGDPPPYYAADAGDWHVIVLDSSSSAAQLLPGSSQYEWLANELATHAERCTIVSLHHPAFSIGPIGDTERLQAIWELVAEYGVEIVLAGHEHDYQRWEPLDATGTPSSTGTTQFVVGTGGHGIRKFVRTDDRVEVGIDETGVYGALRLELHGKRADFAFVSTDGQIHDEGSIPCDNVDP